MSSGELICSTEPGCALWSTGQVRRSDKCPFGSRVTPAQEKALRRQCKLSGQGGPGTAPQGRGGVSTLVLQKGELPGQQPAELVEKAFLVQLAEASLVRFGVGTIVFD
jgi:hypothetical protein